MIKSLYWSVIRLSRSHPIFRLLIDVLGLWFYRIFRSHREFRFQGETYEYFYHPYNRTVAGERIVEIPLAKRLLDKYAGLPILEVGNVMSHYFPVSHDVLDRYETAPGVINRDVVSFKPSQKYQLIISVSTLEHVGQDYGEKPSPRKFLTAVSHLKALLAPGGRLFATFPVSFNPYLRQLIFTRKVPFSKQYFLKRSSFLNDWQEVKFPDLKSDSAYDSQYANADYLFIGEYVKGNHQH